MKKNKVNGIVPLNMTKTKILENQFLNLVINKVLQLQRLLEKRDLKQQQIIMNHRLNLRNSILFKSIFRSFPVE